MRLQDIRRAAAAALGAIALTLLASAHPAQARYKVIHQFCMKQGCGDGYYPSARLLVDPAGNIFGTSVGGGKLGGGTVFELSPNGEHWTYRTLYRARDVDYVVSPLIMDTSGNLYGTTFKGENISTVPPTS